MTPLHKGQMFSIFLDVTGRKQAEEGNDLLAGEMSHRVKNLLAIAPGLTNLTSKSTATAEEMAEMLTGRLAALSRAHDLVRPLPGHQGHAALLGDLLSILLSPYEDMGAFSGRIRVAVPRMGVGEGSATSLALVVHELATNSLKYGALCAATGTLDLSGPSIGEDLELVGWSAEVQQLSRQAELTAMVAVWSTKASRANSAAPLPMIGRCGCNDNASVERKAAGSIASEQARFRCLARQ